MTTYFVILYCVNSYHIARQSSIVSLQLFTHSNTEISFKHTHFHSVYFHFNTEYVYLSGLPVGIGTLYNEFGNVVTKWAPACEGKRSKITVLCLPVQSVSLPLLYYHRRVNHTLWLDRIFILKNLSNQRLWHTNTFLIKAVQNKLENEVVVIVLRCSFLFYQNQKHGLKTRNIH